MMCINIAFDYLQWCTLWDRDIFTILNLLVTYVLTDAKILFDLSFVNSSKMVLPLKYCEHYCASCRICSSVVLVTLCFYPDKLVLTLKFIKKKPLCCFLLLLFYKSWQKTQSGQSCNVNCSLHYLYSLFVMENLFQIKLLSLFLHCFADPGRSEVCFWNCPLWTFKKNLISLFSPVFWERRWRLFRTRIK